MLRRRQFILDNGRREISSKSPLRSTADNTLKSIVHLIFYDSAIESLLPTLWLLPLSSIWYINLITKITDFCSNSIYRILMHVKHTLCKYCHPCSVWTSNARLFMYNSWRWRSYRFYDRMIKRASDLRDQFRIVVLLMAIEHNKHSYGRWLLVVPLSTSIYIGL